MMFPNYPFNEFKRIRGEASIKKGKHCNVDVVNIMSDSSLLSLGGLLLMFWSERRDSLFAFTFIFNSLFSLSETYK